MQGRLITLPQRGRGLGAVFAILILALPAAVVSAAERREVKEPYYGEVLFYFYQQKYFSALSHLMTSQQFERLGQHAEDAELLRGGMLLSYGQHVEAGRIFERLMEKGVAPALRDRIWFYLAKIRYQRGYVTDAEQALARIENNLPGELEDERRILEATLLMSRQEYRKAAERLESLNTKSSWSHYGRYNLGVALVKAGEPNKGIALLEQVGRLKSRDPELAALRDKANVALGFTYLQDGWPELARGYLERVRLNGLLSNKALLGMGWAYSARDDQERALVHWNELQNRNRLDAAVQESILAVPYALGKLGAYQQSLAKYEEAIDVYTQETNRLEASIDAIRAGKLGALLLQEDTAEEDGWFWKLERLPDAPESRYLQHLLAGHDFQEALKNYRDLRFVQARLEQWSSDIAIYGDMLSTRRAGFANRLPQVLRSKRVQDLPKLEAKRDALAAGLARIENEASTDALATPQEQEHLARLERIRDRLQRRVDPSADTQERFRRLEGLLIWNMAVDFKARQWESRKSLNELDRLLQESQTRRAALERAQQETPARFRAFDERIGALAPRIAQLRSRTQELARAQENYLGELAIAELRQQQERLATYLTQARFAVAQTYDRSSDGSAPAPVEAP